MKQTRKKLQRVLFRKWTQKKAKILTVAIKVNIYIRISIYLKIKLASVKYLILKT